MQFFRWICFFASFSLVAAAFGVERTKAIPTEKEDVQRESSLMFSVGNSVHSGSLSSESSTLNLGISLLSYVPKTDVHELWSSGPRYASLTSFGIGASIFEVRDNSPFPFVNANGEGDKVSLSMLSFGTLLCFTTTEYLQICPGAEIAYLMLDPNDEGARDLKNEQGYGTILLDLRIGHYLGKGLKGGFEIERASVSQVVQDRNSNFTMMTYRLSLGFSI